VFYIVNSSLQSSQSYQFFVGLPEKELPSLLQTNHFAFFLDIYFILKSDRQSSGHKWLTFKSVGNGTDFEIVYADRRILKSSSSEYFQKLFGDQFMYTRKANVEEFGVVVFKMIIEWIYTIKIKQLNSLPDNAFVAVYDASIFYGMNDISESICFRGSIRCFDLLRDE
jgi:hypothetical protein